MTNRKAWKEFVGVFRTKFLLIHLGIASGLFALSLLGLILFLGAYTRHGSEYPMPDLRGMTLAEIRKSSFAEKFMFFVNDSIYSEYSKKGSILLQNPIPGSKVKAGRKVYVTVVAILPEQVPVPDLKYLTLRQALNVLKSNKLNGGKLIYIPSFDHNAVLKQLYEGDTIAAGALVNTGSFIDLVLGTGNIVRRTEIPMLIGKTAQEARYAAHVASLNIGREFFPPTDTAGTMRVFQQNPVWKGNMVFYPGDSMHLWYRSDVSFDFSAYLKQLDTDTLRIDTIKFSDRT